MDEGTSSKYHAALAVAALLTIGLAGCVSNTASDANPAAAAEADLPWANFAQARTASGPVFEPAGESPLRVKWLTPSTPDDVPQGQSSIHLLIFEQGQAKPVTDATVTLASRMPAMGHGTSAEEHPGHVAFGVYEGVINPIMGGHWVLGLTVNTSDGQTLEFEIGYDVAGGMDGGMGGDHGEHAMPSFDSFEAAHDANGTTVHAEHHDGPLRLKLLHPESAHVDGPGEHPVLLLLFDHDADAPVTDANLTLESWMPPHAQGDGMMAGHGTGNQEETDPAPKHHGLYEGAVHPIMNGTWQMNVTLHQGDGEETLFSIEYTVGEGDHDSHGDHDAEGGHGEHADEHEGHGTRVDYESFDEAMAADGTTHEPNATHAGPLRLKMLDPAHDHVNETGERHVVFVLYDNATREPVTDANFSAESDHCDDDAAFCAWMPAMGHGCACNEVHPEHVEHGVYVAKTNLTMGGDWVLNINPTLHDGDVVAFDVPVHVEDDTGDHDGHNTDDGGHDDGH